MDSALSASDVAMLNNDGFGGNNSFLWIFALLILAGGGFGGLFGNRGDYQQYATAASTNEILSGQKFDALSRQINQVGDGLCSSTYALNNAIVNEGRTLGAAVNTGFANLQSCCCDLKYDMATQFANANANTTAQVQKVLDAMAQNKIDSLQAEVNSLKTQSMFCGLPRINPYGYGVYQYNNGCNCGNI